MSYNLLTRYGLKADPDRSFSISYIDGFLDCSYQTFLSHVCGLRAFAAKSIHLTFGTACHRGLARANRLIMEDALYCKKCPHPCKINTPDRAKHINTPPEECKIKKMLMEEFMIEFGPEFEEELLITNPSKSKEELISSVMELRPIGYKCMEDVVFSSQPIGDVLVRESTFRSKLGEHDVMGILDLVLEIEREGGNKVLFADYKTTGAYKKGAFPMRQLMFYTHILESLGLPVDGLASIYLLKKNPPKTQRKGSEPFKQSKMEFFSLDNPTNRELYKKTIDDIHEDIKVVRGCLSNGLFSRNRRSMFCRTCEYKAYCDSDKRLEAFLSENKN